MTDLELDYFLARFYAGLRKDDSHLYSTIVTREMVWKLGELQSVYNELQFDVEIASPCTNLLKFY